MLNIVKYPNKILRTRTLKVKDFDTPELNNFAQELTETMIKEDGIGLAANQVDKNLRMLAVNFADQPLVVINPVIYWKSFKKESGEEGCLSFPGVWGIVKRSKKIRLVFKDQTGKTRHLKAEGLLARVLLHEIDHINGVLFIDRITKYIKGKNKILAWQQQAKAEEK